MIMSSTVELDENFFICTICNDSYDDPRSLPCLHSFCRDCLSQHICYSAMDSPPSFLCPVCRGLTLVPSEGRPMEEWADFFPGNFWLKDLMSQMSPSAVVDRTALGLFGQCLHHPEQQLTSFCVCCQAIACNICANVEHGSCSRLVGLDQIGRGSKDDIRSSIEKLDNNIAKTQTHVHQMENDLSYLTRQRDKARNAIENHAATFILKVDRAKKEILAKLDSDYHTLRRDIDMQLATNNKRMQELLSMKATANETLQKPDPEAAREVNQLMMKIEETVSRSASQVIPRFERMRATFSPDYSWMNTEICLGSVTFYNSKLPAGPTEGSYDAPPTLTRSQSSVQLRHPPSQDIGHITTHRPTSAPLQHQRMMSAPLQENQSINEHLVPDMVFPGDVTIPRCLSAPRLQEQYTVKISQSSLQQTSESANITSTDTAAFSSKFEPVKEEKNKDKYCSVLRTNTLLKPQYSPPNFTCGEDSTESSAVSIGQESGSDLFEYTKETVKENNCRNIGEYCSQSKSHHHQRHLSSSDPHAAEENPQVAPSRILTRFHLRSEGDQHLPVITNIIVLPDGCIMVADSANTSIKTFKNENLIFSIKLQHKPYGLAAASDDRAVASTPESKELVISSLVDPKIISTMKVQKCYTRLMKYRQGIIAALSPDFGCIDLVTLQGKAMKSFVISDQLCNDIPFSVAANQEIIVWDSSKPCLVSVSRSGSKVDKEVCSYLKDKDVSGICWDASGLIYVIHDNMLVVMPFTTSRDTVSTVDNVFSCQCMCASNDGKMYVVETGGECKILERASQSNRS